MNMKMSPLSKLYVAFIMMLLYAPIVVMIVFSFNSSASTSVMTGFSLKWYESLLHDSATINALKNTLILAVLSAVIATVLGTLAAVGIYKLKNKFIQVQACQFLMLIMTRNFSEKYRLLPQSPSEARFQLR